ncbi:C3a anaphylatoxin chemotactic receptor isoform 2-T2 [Thomomys bottae]
MLAISQMEFNEMNPSHLQAQTWFSPLMILSLGILALTCVLGLPGNGLVLWVCGFKMQRTVNSVWYFHLTLADFLCCLSLPFSLYHIAVQGRWPYGWFLCKVLPSVVLLNMFTSVFVLTAISVDRCLVVLKPIWCQNHRNVKVTLMVCACIWVLAFVLCVPVFLYRDTFVENGQQMCGYSFSGRDHNAPDSYEAALLDSEALESTLEESLESTLEESTDLDELPSIQLLSGLLSDEDWIDSNGTDGYVYVPDDIYQDGVEVDIPPELVAMMLSRLLLGFVLPSVIMVACYGAVVVRMRRSHVSKSSKKTFRVALVIVIVFLLCWTPYHIVGVLILYSEQEIPDMVALRGWDHFSVALASANSCFNPFLYAFLGKSFRKKTRQSLKGLLEAAFSEETTNSTSVSHSRVSMSTGV